MPAGPRAEDLSPWSCRVCEVVQRGARFACPSRRTVDWTTFDYGECAACGSLTLLDDIDPAPFYVDYERHRRAAVRPSRPRRALGAAAEHTLMRAGRAFAPITRMVRRPYWIRWVGGTGRRRDAAILDVGAGGGATLADLARHGFTNLRGCDPYLDHDTDIGSGVVVEATSIDGTSVREAAIIVIQHVLEHVDDPADLLRRAADRLAEGGRIVVEVPVAEGAAWQEFRDNWVGVDPPVHRFVPTTVGMRQLAAHAGLRVVRSYGDTSSFHYEASDRIAHRQSAATGPTSPDRTARRHLRSKVRRARRRAPDQRTFLLCLDERT